MGLVLVKDEIIIGLGRVVPPPTDSVWRWSRPWPTMKNSKVYQGNLLVLVIMTDKLAAIYCQKSSVLYD